MRDLLLQRPVGDLDLTVEGDAPSLARDLARALGARAQVHARFQTATLELTGGERLDLAIRAYGNLPAPGRASGRPARAHRGGSDPPGFHNQRDGAQARSRLRATAARSDRRPAGPAGRRHPLPARPLPDRMTRPARFGRSVTRTASVSGFRGTPGARFGRRSRRGCFEAVSGDRLRRELEKILSERDRAGAVRRLRGARSPSRTASFAPRVTRGLRADAVEGRSSTRPPRDWLTYLQVWATELTRCGRDASSPAALNLSRKDAHGLRGATPARALSVALALSIAGKNLLAAGASPGPAIGGPWPETLIARREGRITRGRRAGVRPRGVAGAVSETRRGSARFCLAVAAVGGRRNQSPRLRRRSAWSGSGSPRRDTNA